MACLWLIVTDVGRRAGGASLPTYCRPVVKTFPVGAKLRANRGFASAISACRVTDGISRTDQLIPARSLEGELESPAECDRRLPAQDLTRLGDVGAAYLGVVGRQCLVDDL